MSASKNIPTFSDYLMQFKNVTPKNSPFCVGSPDMTNSNFGNQSPEFRGFRADPRKPCGESNTLANANRDLNNCPRISEIDGDKAKKRKVQPIQDPSSLVAGFHSQRDQQEHFNSKYGKENNPNNIEFPKEDALLRKINHGRRGSSIITGIPDYTPSVQKFSDQKFEFEKAILSQCMNSSKYNNSRKSLKNTQTGLNNSSNTTRQEIQSSVPENNVISYEGEERLEGKNPTKANSDGLENTNSSTHNSRLINGILQSTVNSPQESLRARVGSLSGMGENQTKQIDKPLRQLATSEEFQGQAIFGMPKAVNELESTKSTKGQQEEKDDVESGKFKAKGENTTSLSVEEKQDSQDQFHPVTSREEKPSSIRNSPAKLTKHGIGTTSTAFIQLYSEQSELQSPKGYQVCNLPIISTGRTDSQPKTVYEIRLIISTNGENDTKNSLEVGSIKSAHDLAKSTQNDCRSSQPQSITVKLIDSTDMNPRNDNSISIIVAPHLQKTCSIEAVRSMQTTPKDHFVHENISMNKILIDEDRNGEGSTTIRNSCPVMENSSKEFHQSSKLSNKSTRNSDYSEKSCVTPQNNSSSVSLKTGRLITPTLTNGSKNNEAQVKLASHRKWDSRTSLKSSTTKTTISPNLKKAMDTDIAKSNCANSQSAEMKAETNHGLKLSKTTSLNSKSQTDLTQTPRGTKIHSRTLKRDQSTPSFASNSKGCIETQREYSMKTSVLRSAASQLTKGSERLKGRSSSMASGDFNQLVCKIDLWPEIQKLQVTKKPQNIMSPRDEVQMDNSTLSGNKTARDSSNIKNIDSCTADKTQTQTFKLIYEPFTKPVVSAKDRKPKGTYQERKKDWWNGVYTNLNKFSQK